MRVECFVAGRDDGLEAEWSDRSASIRDLAGVRLPHWELLYGETEKIKAALTVVAVQRVTDPRLAWFQFQTHAGQPVTGDLLCKFDDHHVLVQDHEVVRVAHHQRFPWMTSTRIVGECGADRRFETVQCDVGEQWRDHPALRRTLSGRE